MFHMSLKNKGPTVVVTPREPDVEVSLDGIEIKSVSSNATAVCMSIGNDHLYTTVDNLEPLKICIEEFLKAKKKGKD